MHSIPVLSELEESELEALRNTLSKHTYKSGAHMIRLKEDATSIMFLAEGKARVSLTGNDGKEVVLAHLEQGDFFGEIALLTGEKRSADVTALKPCTTLNLSKDDFERLSGTHNGLTSRLLKELAARLRGASSKIGDLALLDVYRRVASVLFELATDSDDKKEKVIPKRPTHNELAAMVGTSREMVTRALKNLELDGHIRTEGKTIVLLSKPH